MLRKKRKKLQTMKFREIWTLMEIIPFGNINSRLFFVCLFFVFVFVFLFCFVFLKLVTKFKKVIIVNYAKLSVI